MGPVHLLAQRCSHLIFMVTALAIGCTSALWHKNDAKIIKGFDYEHLQHIKELAEPLTFVRFTEPSESLMKVGFTSETQVDSITDLLLAVIKYNGNDPSEQSWFSSSDTVDSIAAGEEVIHNFPIGDTSLSEITDGDEVHLVIIAHDENINALAAGEFKFIYHSTSASLAWVGAPSDDSSAFLRVGSGPSVTIGDNCKCDGIQPCYCKQPDVSESDLELCVEVQGTGNNGVSLKPLQCNEVVTPISFAEISAVDNAELHTKTDNTREFELSATYAVTSETAQVLFYKEGDAPTESTDCTANAQPCIAVPLEDTTFNILLVALNEENAVVESILITFEDYLVVAKKLTVDALEVSWTGSSSKIASNSDGLAPATEYVVQIDDENAPFAETEGNKCTNSDCKAYFVQTQAATVKCTVHIKGDETIKTSRSLDMASDPTPAQGKFTSINKIDSSITTIQIQSDSAINSGDAVSLVVIADDGSEDIYEGTSANVRVDSIYQFEVALPLAVNTFFVLVGHGSSDDITIAGTASGVINEFGTNLAWVGGAPGSEVATLRISTTDEVTFGDSACSCTSENSPCYCVHTKLEETDIVVCSDLGDGVQYCDISIGVTSFEDIPNAKISRSRLMYPLPPGEVYYEFKVDNGNVAKYELLSWLGDIDHDKESIASCEGEVFNQTLSSVPDEGKTYNVLAVVIDSSNTVLQSKEFLFEDSKVIVEQLLEDMLWVKWTPYEDYTYTIDCTPEKEDYPYPSNTTNRCDPDGVSSCMVIFSDLKCEGVYTSEVVKNSNRVAGQVYMECDAAEVRITRVVQERRSSGSSTMSVCFAAGEVNNTDVSSLNLLVYNNRGLIYEAKDPKQGSEASEHCFPSVSMDVESMGLNELITFIVHPTKQAKAELYLLDISLNQVEDNTLKANWKSKNNPMNYTILFDDLITFVDNKECLQYGDCVKYLHLQEGQRESTNSITFIEEGNFIQELHLDMPEFTSIDSES